VLHEVNAIKILENKTGLSSCIGQYLNLVGFCWMVYGKCPLYTILKDRIDFVQHMTSLICKFEDTKWVIRSRKSKDRPYNDINTKRINNDLQKRLHGQLKIEQQLPHKKQG
jgi:hypothetical protein